jgi:hypothetical protein
VAENKILTFLKNFLLPTFFSSPPFVEGRGESPAQLNGPLPAAILIFHPAHILA